MADDAPQSGTTAQDLLSASAGESRDPSGSLRAQIANAMVGMKKRYYGRGPDAAKAWILDDYVFVAMENGLTRGEETMVADGKEREVREFRLSFEETMTSVAKAAIQELTGREVIGYHSQVVFDPTRTFEIFVLAPEG